MTNIFGYDPPETDEVFGSVSAGDFAPYLKAVGNIAGSFLGGNQQKQGPDGSAQAMQNMMQMQLAQQAAIQQEAARKSAETTKTILIVGGAVVGFGLLSTLVYFLAKKK